MFKISICDDHKDICSQLKNIIIDICNNLKIKYSIDIFYDGESLCESLKNNNTYNLIFLDIELTGINGVDIGGIIRNKYKDDVTQIAYISGKTKYAMELFKVQPVDFLIKPLKQTDIENIINKVIKIKGIDSGFFSYKYQQKIFNIPISEIIYFEKDKRKIYIKTKVENDKHHFYGKLEDIQTKQLKKYNFLHIHKSYLVNYYYVKIFGYENLTMNSGEVFPISRSKAKEIRELQFNLEKSRNG